MTGPAGGRAAGSPARARGAPAARRPCRTATTITSSVRATTRPPTSSRLHSSALTMWLAMATATSMILPQREVNRSGREVGGGQPGPALTVVNLNPSACICGISRSSAATVSLRSPPASCSSTTRPWPSSGTALCTIAPTPGRCQSSAVHIDERGDVALLPQPGDHLEAGGRRARRAPTSTAAASGSSARRRPRQRILGLGHLPVDPVRRHLGQIGVGERVEPISEPARGSGVPGPGRGPPTTRPRRTWRARGTSPAPRGPAGSTSDRDRRRTSTPPCAAAWRCSADGHGSGRSPGLPRSPPPGPPSRPRRSRPRARRSRPATEPSR